MKALFRAATLCYMYRLICDVISFKKSHEHAEETRKIATDVLFISLYLLLSG